MVRKWMSCLLMLLALGMTGQDFAQTIEGKKFVVNHNPDANSPDAEFEASTHHFLSGGKYTINHPKGTFNGNWKFTASSGILEISVNISGISKKYQGSVQKLSNTKFIFDLVVDKDGNYESLLFEER